MLRAHWLLTLALASAILWSPIGRADTGDTGDADTGIMDTDRDTAVQPGASMLADEAGGCRCSTGTPNGILAIAFTALAVTRRRRGHRLITR